MSMIEKYLKDDQTHERVANAILAFHDHWENSDWSSDLATFIINDLLDELQEEPPDPTGFINAHVVVDEATWNAMMSDE